MLAPRMLFGLGWVESIFVGLYLAGMFSWSAVMTPIQFRFSDLRLAGKAPPLRFSATICCGLRDGRRDPLWRGRVLSTESIQAVQALKLAARAPSASPDRVRTVLQARVRRLLKADAVAALVELQRQNEWEIAVQVFESIQQEVWYKPDLFLYNDMLLMLGKNKLIEYAEQVFSEIKEVGLLPDTRTYTEMIGAYMQVGMVEKAMDTYRLMKESGCNPDRLTLTVLIRNLEKFGEEDLASAVRKDCSEYLDFPRKFLKEVDMKYPKRRSLEPKA